MSMRKYEEVLAEGRGRRVPRSKGSKGSKVRGSQGPRGPRDQDILNSHSNTSLTLKKVHLVGIKNLAFIYPATHDFIS